jgi:hypothetical protein
MAQESGLAQRGFLLLGLMLAIVALVGFVLFRPKPHPPIEDEQDAELVAMGVPNPGAGFPGEINWGAAAVLGKHLPSSPGWMVRYNATLTLARRGSTQTPFAILAEMLDEDRQKRNFRVRLADGKEVADESAARRTVFDTLEAFGEWQKHKEAVQAAGNNPDLQRVYAAIDKLTQSPDETLRKEAESVKKTTSSH